MSIQHRIVIVGGGAGGLELASLLGRRLGRRDEAVITLIDASLVHVWKPLYHEVAAGTLDSQADAVNFLAQAHRCHFHFQYGRLCGLDRNRKQVKLAPIKAEDGTDIVPARSIDYDTLVIAIGSVSNHFGTPGAAEHCFHLDELEEADAFHHRLMQLMLRAQADRIRSSNYPSLSSARGQPASSWLPSLEVPRSAPSTMGSTISTPSAISNSP
ncbi:NAD(P)/FAD-dependent oxidoreductase [Alkalilimnicola ehrlichii]|uniref:NAD(P)/FAD-dependent oxidoreductase n=1 Tax=Alkalilimnicola ehrlichii TaxID=351052 RepID=UPI001C6DE85E|nr:FAD-dependent oxidoreductase [Alkalilimnicola ehrlichii]